LLLLSECELEFESRYCVGLLYRCPQKTKPTTFSSVSKPQLYAVIFGIAIQETTASLAMIMSPTSSA